MAYPVRICDFRNQIADLPSSLGYICRRLVGMTVDRVRQTGCYQGRFTAGEFCSAFSEQFLCCGFRSVNAFSHFRYIEINLEDTLLAPYPFNKYREVCLECFSQISVYARNNYSIHSLLKDAVKLPEETDIYFITSFVTDKNAELIRALRRRGRSVSVIRLEGRDEA